MKFREIVFLQDSNATEALNLLKEDSDAAFEYLKQWDYGEGEESENPPWGEGDRRIRFPKEGTIEYVLSYNRSLDYISLTAIE